MVEQPFSTFHHFVHVHKKNRRPSVHPKNIAMLHRILHQHARTHSCSFKSSHRMAVPVGAPHKAKGYFSPRGRQPKRPYIRIAAPLRASSSFLSPIVAKKGNVKPRVLKGVYK